MTAAAPTVGQIKARLATIPEKSRRGKAIGIHCPGRWPGASTVEVEGHEFVIHQCNSPLEMRMVLREPIAASATKVLITSLRDGDVGDDVLLRLAKRRLFEIKPWEIVRSLFDAHVVDPRLTKRRWLAEVLLEILPDEGLPVARGGFLDAETVWALLLEQSMGLTSATPDLTAILKWSLDVKGTERFRNQREEFRNAVIEWLAEKAGPVAEVVLGCIGRLDRPDAVPVGLAAGTVYDPRASGQLEKASGKLDERFLGGRTPSADLVLRWSTAATEVVRSLRHTDSPRYRQTLQRFDDILREVGAEDFAHLSDTSLLGFDQRLARFGACLSDTLERRGWDQLAELDEAWRVIREHDRAQREPRQVERAEMSLRLLRWMGTQQSHTPRYDSFAEAAVDYLREGGFVDWARLCLRTMEPVQGLSTAYSRLFDMVRERREKQSKAFADLLADWTAAGSKSDDVVPVERILEDVVAPLASDQQVLVIVIDGMSVAVGRELLANLVQHDWTPLCEPGRDFNRPGIATIPSVTEFSRTSLLSGSLRQGTSSDEAREFPGHKALVAQSRSRNPPVLFHKAGLQDSDEADLAKDVRDAIQSTHRKVVGVVINAVDDHLMKGDQIDTRWSRDAIRVLPALLHEARVARRLVVLLSDHGHILDVHAVGRQGDAGERYRAGAGEPAEDEVVVTGQRVLADDHRVIAPWSERVRYGIKKNGYHGGVTPQEMIVPIIVLSSTDDLPAGWHGQPLDMPSWWDEPSAPAPQPSRPGPKLKPKPKETLFDDTEPVEVDVDRTAPEVPQWVTRLLDCAVFEEQKRLGGRGLPADAVFAELLSLLDQRGGKMTSPALARALRYPPMRLRGLLAKAERVLNIDAYDILRRDDTANMVELNRELLLKQFDLVEGP